MATPKYDKWTVHSWTGPGGLPGAEVHDNADGVTYHVTTRTDRDGRALLASVQIVTSAEGGGVDKALIRRVPLALLRDFALSQVRQEKALEPGEILVDLTHHGTTEGQRRTAHPDDRADLEAFAALYNSLGRRVRTQGGRTRARRDYLVAETESPHYGMSYSWLDKRTRRAKSEGLIPEAPKTPDGKPAGSRERKNTK